MKLVLLSGGSGKRLWPMSNDVRSKQFLKVLKDENGARVSMLQRVWSQVEQAGLLDEAYICASSAQAEIIGAQIGDVSVIVEPSRRDTFPAIALASTYLSHASLQELDDIVAVAPVDHYVDGEFFEAIAALEATLIESGADLALLGVGPTEPSSQYGYIQVDSKSRQECSYLRVSTFTEKPAEADAAELIQNGALWNCGVFCFRLSFMRQFLLDNGYPTTFQDLLHSYDILPKRSFDFEVVEHTGSIVVQPYYGRWKDLGTWQSLVQELSDSFDGLGRSHGCHETHILNELNVPLVAKGLRGLVVVATADGILVADKAQSGDIKTLVNELSDRPRYEETRWGSYQVLHHERFLDGSEVLTKMVDLFPGASLSYHKHLLREETWTVVRGRGELAMHGKVTPISPGDLVRVSRDEWHAIRAVDELSLIEVQRGTHLTEEDVLRRFTSWEDIVNHCGLVTR